MCKIWSELVKISVSYDQNKFSHVSLMKRTWRIKSMHQKHIFCSFPLAKHTSLNPSFFGGSVFDLSQKQPFLKEEIENRTPRKASFPVRIWPFFMWTRGNAKKKTPHTIQTILGFFFFNGKWLFFRGKLKFSVIFQDGNGISKRAG